jgi:anti-anti-sigma factor
MSEQQPRRPLKVKTVGDVTLVQFADSRILQEEDIQATFDLLGRILDQRGVRELVLDFRRVKFLSSAVLGRLMLTHKKLRSAGGRVILCGIAEDIFEVFKITKLDAFFTIEPDVEAALAAFGVRLESMAGGPGE